MQTPQRSADPLHDAIGFTAADHDGPAGPLVTGTATDTAAAPAQILVPRKPEPAAPALASSRTGGGGNLRASSSALGVLVGILVVLAILALL